MAMQFPEHEADPAVAARAVVDLAIETTFASFYAKERNRIAAALTVTIGNKALAGEAADEAMARKFQRWNTVRSFDNPCGSNHDQHAAKMDHLGRQALRRAVGMTESLEQIG